MLVTSNFSLSHSVFYPFEEISAIFINFEIVVCKLFQFGRVKNLPFGKGLNSSVGFEKVENIVGKGKSGGYMYVYDFYSLFFRVHSLTLDYTILTFHNPEDEAF